MPFEAAPVEAKGKFVPLAEEKVYRAETNSMITAPSAMTGKEIGYHDDVSKGTNPQQYFGFSKVLNTTKDIAMIPLNSVKNFTTGAGATAVSSATTLAAGSNKRLADSIDLGLQYDFDTISKKKAAGEALNADETKILLRGIADKNNLFSFFTRSVDDIAFDTANSADAVGAERLANKSAKLNQSVIDMRVRSDEYIEKNLKRPDGDAAQGFLYDLGGVTTAIAASIGMAVVTKNPVSSAAFFSELQKDSLYLEGSDKGINVTKNQDVSDFGGKIEGALEFVGVHYFFKIAENSKPLWGVLGKMGEEALQEMAQQGSEEAITQSQGYRDVNVGQAISNTLYAGFLGMFGAGGGIAARNTLEGASYRSSSVKSVFVNRPWSYNSTRRGSSQGRFGRIHRHKLTS